jgi:hypothetical protein
MAVFDPSRNENPEQTQAKIGTVDNIIDEFMDTNQAKVQEDRQGSLILVL